MQHKGEKTDDGSLIRLSNISNEVEWFFFDLFYLHYIEDYESGLSFTLPSELQWSFYIEVSYYDMILFLPMCHVITIGLELPHLILYDRIK